MSPDELVAWAVMTIRQNENAQQRIEVASVDPETLRVARAILRLLDVEWPCGWPEPEIDRGLCPPGVVWEVLGTQAIAPEESIAMGADLIRAGYEAAEAAKEPR